jgi:myosin protein heavy chain
MTAPPSISATPSKRRKRTRTAAEPEAEAIVEEEEIITTHTTVNPACDTNGGAEDIDTVEVSEKHVRFGGEDNEPTGSFIEVTDYKTTATHITPHPNKTMMVKRRTTASPHLGADGVKRVKRFSTRHSLPSALSGQDGEPEYLLEEHEYAPLQEVLEARMSQRLQQHAARDARMRQLSSQLETETQMGNFERVEHIEVELARLRDEQKSALADALANDVDMPDDNMLVLESRGEIAYPDLPAESDVQITEKRTSRGTSFGRSSTLRDSTWVAKQEEWDVDRKNYQDAILALQREANDAKSMLRILEIEVQGLAFAGDNVSSVDVLHTIKTSFARVREQVQAAIPNSVPEDVTIEELIEILGQHVEEFADRLKTQDKELYEKGVVVADLSKQVQGLLDHLAEAKIRNQKLQESWNELDKSNDHNARDIEELQEELGAVELERDTLQSDLDEQTEKLKAAFKENIEFAGQMAILNTQVHEYIKIEKKLETQIIELENNHATEIERLTSKQEAIVGDLEERLNEQTHGREGAAQLAEDRQVKITALEQQILNVETEREALRTDLEHNKTLREEDLEALATTEKDLAEKSTEVESLDSRVVRLEDDLVELNNELDNLRRAVETERTQRISAEEELDDRNNEIDDLNDKLREQGVQANELRQKLFEVQQANQKKVKDLEQLASEREEQFQLDIAEEVDRREKADELAQERAGTIEDLEESIKDIEEEMRSKLAERDARIEALELAVNQKNAELETFEVELRTAEEAYDDLKAQSTREAEDLEASIATLQSTITEHEEKIAGLHEEKITMVDSHNSQIDDRNARIAELNLLVADHETQKRGLAAEVQSLERRVTAEAEQMLQLQAEKEEEIEALKQQIRDKHAKILVVEEKATLADKYVLTQIIYALPQANIFPVNGKKSSSTVTLTSTNLRPNAWRPARPSFSSRPTTTA